MDDEKKEILIFFGGAVLVIVILLFLFGGFRTVKSGQVGLKVRFGEVTDAKLHEGINFKLPLIEKIVKIDIKVQKIEESTESSTKDMQIVSTTVAVNYHVNSDSAVSLYKNVGKDYQNTILIPAIRESIKSAIAEYNAEEITTKRVEVSASCLEAIQSKVEKYGITIDDFNLTDFGFSDEYTRAIEEKQVAEQNLEKAKLEAEQKIVEATAEKEANELKQQTLTDEILKEKFIEKWNGELPKVTSNSNIFDVSGLLN